MLKQKRDSSSLFSEMECFAVICIFCIYFVDTENVMLHMEKMLAVFLLRINQSTNTPPYVIQTPVQITRVIRISKLFIEIKPYLFVLIMQEFAAKFQKFS